MSDSLRPPWTITYQALQSMEFSRQEYWSGLPFPSPGDLPDPGIEPGSPTLQADVLSSEPPGKPWERLGKPAVLITWPLGPCTAEVGVRLPGPVAQGLGVLIVWGTEFCFISGFSLLGPLWM